ncbi:putative hydrolase TatD [Blattamonas nauphoetae]|uniref:Hydrolase TatD n=1 Tax=Blattamonas nauphoetae TaxID=2049346 RepID=A0ABQ9YCJ4_9EUKA|nr:putative hydrolase TatD [Blattamonas nauphoetae]
MTKQLIFPPKAILESHSFIVDTHCHLCDCLTVHPLLENSREHNVNIIISNATNPCDWEENLTFCEEVHIQYHNLPPDQPLHPSLPFPIPFLGLHPWMIKHQPTTWLDDLRTLLLQYPMCGVGEIGLDKIKIASQKFPDYPTFPMQTAAFRQQIDLAFELNRPCSVHCVRSVGNICDILTKQRNKQRLPPAVILHSYGGPHDFIPLLLEACTPVSTIPPKTKHFHLPKEEVLANSRLFFSFSGTILDKTGRDPLAVCVREIPRDRILIETDAPTFDSMYAAFEEGACSEPASTRLVLKHVTELLNEGRCPAESQEGEHTNDQPLPSEVDNPLLTEQDVIAQMFSTFKRAYSSILTITHKQSDP